VMDCGNDSRRLGAERRAGACAPLAQTLAGRRHRVIAALRELRRAGVMVDRRSATESPRSGVLP
jgi:hypothetical protein